MSNKRTRGRIKIEMKKIEDHDDLIVTFSKRRAGLFKKASEICSLCDIDMGLFIFSPSGKPYSFANPNVKSIADRFFHRTTQQPHDEIAEIRKILKKLKIDELNQKLNELSVRFEGEEERKRRLERTSSSCLHAEKKWFEKDIEEMNMVEVDSMISWFQRSQEIFNNELNERAKGTSLGN